MDNQRHTLNKKSEHVYHYKIAGLVAGALFLGTLISAVLFLSGDKILHSYFETSDYLYRIETHRMYTLQNWVNENNISASDTDQLSEWMSQQNLSNMFIQRNDNSLFRNLSTKSFHPAQYFRYNLFRMLRNAMHTGSIFLMVLLMSLSMRALNKNII